MRQQQAWASGMDNRSRSVQCNHTRCFADAQLRHPIVEVWLMMAAIAVMLAVSYPVNAISTKESFDPLTTLFCTQDNGFESKDDAKACVVNACIEYHGGTTPCSPGENGTSGGWFNIGNNKEAFDHHYIWLPNNGDFRIRAIRCKNGESPNRAGVCGPVNPEKTRPCEPSSPCGEGKPSPHPPSFGNPINVMTGNKYEVETDYQGSGPFPLRFVRNYNSQLLVSDNHDMTGHWRHNYQRRVKSVDLHGDGTLIARVIRANGRTLDFEQDTSGNWVSDADVVERLTETLDGGGVQDGWQLITATDAVEHYDLSGKLLSVTNRYGFTQTLAYTGDDLTQVTDPFGRTLSFTYDPVTGWLETLSAPGGEVYRYEYDAGTGLLTAVVYPDETPGDPNDNPRREYHYEDATNPGALTRLVNERGIDYGTWTYDSVGRAISSQHAGGVDSVTVDYAPATGDVSVLDALGTVRVLTFGAAHGTGFAADVSGGPCAACGLTHASQSRDANGFVDSGVDFNNNTTTYVHDASGLETSRTEALGTAEARTITTAWHTTFRQPTLISEPGQTTAFTHNADGQVLTETVTDTANGRTRTITRTYTDGSVSGVPKGLIATIDGPRTDVSDVTTYAYHTDGSGNVHTVTNALGHVTTFTHYDAHGRATRWVEANGLVSEVDYDARGRMVEVRVDGLATQMTYDAAGNRTRVTQADGSYLNYTYDGANRVTRVTDALGHYTEYTLDDAGNIIDTTVYDPSGVLARAHAQVFDGLGRLVFTIGGEGQTNETRYDAEGNRTASIDAKLQQTDLSYDALNRQLSTTAPDAGTTSFTYDARDNLTSVTDARGKVTTYGYNGMDDVESVASPDTGLTTYTTDDAGNRVTETNARGIAVTYVYDALNRVTAVQYPDASEDVSVVYDTGLNGIGRVATVTDASGSVSYEYDLRGNMVKATRTITGTSYITEYRYDAADRVAGLTYPSGIDIDYLRDAAGRVTSVTMTASGVTTTLANAIGYEPMGAMKTLTYGNGPTESRSFDNAGRLIALSTLGVMERSYGYDDNDNIVSLLDTLETSYDQSFGYDAANRLAHADGRYGGRDYAYDAIGGRERLKVDGASLPFNTTMGAPTPKTLTYNDAGRIETMTVDGVLAGSYVYNAHGERTQKTVGGTTTRFVYQGDGLLLSEDDGTRVREYVQLDGRPIAVMDSDAVGVTVHYVHADHLSTPQRATDALGAVIWRSDHTPYGESAIDSDPDGDGIHYTFNLRFPGQYFDAESGVHYNYYRYYDPSTGRYLRSDPIGLNGGVNTYGYATANPLRNIDPLGLQVIVGAGASATGPSAVSTGAGILGGGSTPKKPITASNLASELGLSGLGDSLSHTGSLELDIEIAKFLFGGGLISAIAEACSDGEENEIDCKEVKRRCIKQCMRYLGSGGTNYTDCIARCMDDAGCSQYNPDWKT